MAVKYSHCLDSKQDRQQLQMVIANTVAVTHKNMHSKTYHIITVLSHFPLPLFSAFSGISNKCLVILYLFSKMFYQVVKIDVRQGLAAWFPGSCHVTH